MGEKVVAKQAFWPLTATPTTVKPMTMTMTRRRLGALLKRRVATLRESVIDVGITDIARSAVAAVAAREPGLLHAWTCTKRVVVAVGAMDTVTTAVATTTRAAVARALPTVAARNRAAVMKKRQAGLAVVAVGTQENAASAVAVINCSIQQASAGVEHRQTT